MPRLIDRNRQIPNSLKFYIPELKWQSNPWSSFDQIVQQVITLRKANPAMAAKMNWVTDYASVCDEVDYFNAKICESMGWTEFIDIAESGGAPVVPFYQNQPQPQPHSLSQKLRNVAVGADTLIEWIESGAEAVSAELANQRGEICTNCKFNEKGDLLSFFTVPTSEAIRRAYNQRHEFQLSTDYDGRLNVCNICMCPLKLKVHMPIQKIRAKMPEDIAQNLPSWCWIRAEP